MEKYQIGAILTKRIAECGYTQEEFAEISEIPISTLKKYMSGKTAYNYVVLEKLATKLNCSYDYLLGYSCSPEREHHEIKEQTLLSDESIKILCAMKETTENKKDMEQFARLIDEIICHESFLTALLMYCGTNERTNRIASDLSKSFLLGLGINLPKEYEFRNDDAVKLLYLFQDIESIKYRLNPEVKESMSRDLSKLERNLKPSV